MDAVKPTAECNPSEYAETPAHKNPCSPRDASNFSSVQDGSSLLAENHCSDSRGSSCSNSEYPETNRETLQSLAQDIVEEVNLKRQKDSEMLDDYKSAQISQVESFCGRAESHLFEVYKIQNKDMQDKLQELFETLDRIAKLETELQEFRQVLNNLYRDIMSS